MKRSFTPLILLFALLFPSALAVGTPAGTSIENQASATYLDSSGNPQSTTSNLVTTVVQAVYDISILPDGTEGAPGQTEPGLSGQTVYFNYTLTNSGNTSDTVSLAAANLTGVDSFNLSGLTIYLDSNGNGVLDPGETTPISSVALAADASASLIVAGVIPGGTASGSTANVGLAGTSSGNPAETDLGNVAQAVATNSAILSLNKSASLSSVAPGGSVTYTLSGSNIGASAAYAVTNVVTVDGTPRTGILMSDVLPSGLGYVPGSLAGSAGAGSVTLIYSTNGGSTWTATQPASGVNAVGMVIAGSGQFFPQGAAYTLSFGASVPAAASAGTSYANVATLLFDGDNDGDAADGGEDVSSNTTTTSVTASHDVLVGPFGFPAASASGSYSAGGYTVTRSGDVQTVSSANSGVPVTFRHTLRNDGNASDAFSVSTSGAPSGWTVQLFQADGNTPLSGNLGPIAAGATADFVVKAVIPVSYTSLTAQSFTVTVTSVNDGAQSDTTTDTVSEVVSGYGVDLSTKGEANGDDANDNPAPASANPGSSVSFPLDVLNRGGNPDSYDLSATLPALWSATFYQDTNGNGVLEAGEPVVTDTGLLASGALGTFIAVVNVPAGTVPGANGLSFTAVSDTLTTVTDSVSTTVTVNEVSSILFNPDRSGTVASPGAIDYSHTLVNSGSATATVSIPAFASAQGWTYQYSTDGGATFGSSISGLSIPALGSVSVIVRVIVPSGEADGGSEAATITATASYPGGGAAFDSVVDTTTVEIGELRLTKSVDNAAAVPGDTLTYTVQAQNIGTGQLSEIKLSDPLPAFTDFVSVSAVTSMTGTVLYSTDGLTWSASAPTSLPSGGVIYVGVSTNGDTDITSADLMPPAATITVTFVVEVQ